jgi:hypothetical protein
MRSCCCLLAFMTLPWILVASIPSNEKEWSDKMLDIARTYKHYERADRFFRFAPTDCRAPMAQVPQLRLSQSNDPATHGRKLYTVFAKDLHWDQIGPVDKPISIGRTKTYLPPLTEESRLQTGGRRSNNRIQTPVGQAIVKEAWHFTEIGEEDYRKTSTDDLASTKSTRDKGGWTTFDHGKDLLPVAYNSTRQNEKPKYYRGTGIASLFIMTKLDPKTPGTDAGWIYGTVDADLKTVTSVGKVPNCIKCHQDAPHDRLFGLP